MTQPGILPGILIVPAELEFVTASLEAEYELARLWETTAADDIGAIRALVCLGHQSPEALLPRLPSLGLVACFTTGYDGIDVEALRARGIQVSHAMGATAEPVGEFALALILAAYRNVVAGDRMLRSGGWLAGGNPLIGKSLDDARLGIVGLGAIGQAVARRGEALGMHVAWWGPRPKPEAAWPRVDSLQALAHSSDVLVVCTSADESNRGLISAEVIAALGPEGLLVNVARGQLVDEGALIAALHSGELGGAALDVFAMEPTPAERWADVPNVICTPHIAGASRDTLPNMTAMLKANLDAFFSGQPLPNAVGRGAALE
ncbi:MAG TPA: 2-hydroxyacid dehydrogenase [Novosphingobium sp.]|nr:2-hydroxyacid dehydrogenase [Novosphingobium sp.]